MRLSCRGRDRVKCLWYRSVMVKPVNQEAINGINLAKQFGAITPQAHQELMRELEQNGVTVHLIEQAAKLEAGVMAETDRAVTQVAGARAAWNTAATKFERDPNALNPPNRDGIDGAERNAQAMRGKRDLMRVMMLALVNADLPPDMTAADRKRVGQLHDQEIARMERNLGK